MEAMYIAYSWLAVSAAALAGFWLHLHYRRRDRMLTQSADVERLEATVQELRTELDAVTSEFHGRVAELNERVDFAERLLTRSLEAPRPEPAPDRVPTPV